MKGLLIFILVFIICYSVYYDLNTGTLPILHTTAAVENAPISVIENQNDGKLYVEVIVKPGDTVLSLLEQHLSGSLPVSISTVVTDFQSLNNGIPPEKIQIGKTYKLPLYK